MKKASHAAMLVTAIRERVDLPVTVKIRAGGEAGYAKAPEFARTMQEAGAEAVAVHARAPSRKHSGAPRLSAIGEVKAAVSVPVIGNGGIRTPEDAVRMRRETDCDAVMIGRGGIGDVWLFARAAAALERGEVPPLPDGAERLAVFTEHLQLTVNEYGRDRGVVRFRKCVPHYLRDVRGAREGRHAVITLTDPAEIIEAARRLLLP
jgi:tRNA-dihydrouridine synthase